MSCVVVWILLALVATLRFIFLRIAENPKGPVIGFSLFFVALGLLLKAFLPS
jgi:tellurite resistance protein TehA-like permease